MRRLRSTERPFDAAGNVHRRFRLLNPTPPVLLVALLAAGCVGDANVSGEPELAVARVDTWPIPPAGATIPAPRAVTIGPDDTVYVLDNAGRILVFDADGTPRKQWSMPESEVGNPEGIRVLTDGRIAVADTHYHRIVFFDHDGRETGRFGSEGQEPGQFYWPVALVEDDQQNLYISEYGGANRVQKFDAEGKFLLAFGGHGTAPGEFQRPSGMVWHDGRLYIVDAFNDRIQVFRDTGEFIEILGAGEQAARLQYPYDISLGPGGDLFVIEYGAGRITRLDLTGKLIGRFGSTGSGHGQFGTPWGLAIDSKFRVRVADTRNHRLVVLDLSS